MSLRIPAGSCGKTDCAGSVVGRVRTSDIWAFSQVFIEREYEPLIELPSICTILDLGANVGYSSIFFLRAFPNATVIALEPDPQNFAVLQQNLANYADRSTAIWGGAWNSTGSLRLRAETYRDGQAWSRQVERCYEESPNSVPAFDVPSLMAMGGLERVNLLKVDIEGAETLVFDSSSTAWIDRVDNIAIEVHDDSSFGMASPIFWRAVLDRGFSFSRSGELVICSRDR